MSCNRHAASETLRGCQRNPAHVTRIQLRQYLDDDLPLIASTQHRVDRRQMLIEPYIHDTAADRNDRAQGWGLQAFLSGHIQPFRNGKIRRTNNSTLASMMTRQERLRDKQLVSADAIGHCNSNQGERPAA